MVVTDRGLPQLECLGKSSSVEPAGMAARRELETWNQIQEAQALRHPLVPVTTPHTTNRQHGHYTDCRQTLWQKVRR
ncbi:hypothetical protein HYQ46_002403 [Verticillium longisporum]|nr:hypothetical protein HYQ46_002403 [Verticillium longisporum]